MYSLEGLGRELSGGFSVTFVAPTIRIYWSRHDRNQILLPLFIYQVQFRIGREESEALYGYPCGNPCKAQTFANTHRGITPPDSSLLTSQLAVLSRRRQGESLLSGFSF